MQAHPLDIPDVIALVPRVFGDHRGFFLECYSRPKLAEIGIDVEFIQDNHSLSREVGVVRGLHFQAPPFAQAKLIRCIRGAILDVAVDIRVGSSTYGRHVSRVLSAENKEMLYVPAGFAHGFAVLEPDTEVLYKCSNVYAPRSEGGIRWDDPDLAIDWQVKHARVILSDKDLKLPSLADLQSPFVYEAPLAVPAPTR